MKIEIEGRMVEIKNPDKVFWPEEKITKDDLVRYYRSIAKYLLPYLKDRPESLNRFPDGINGQSFYHKNLKEVGPDWLKKFKIHSPSKGQTDEYLLCQDEATLAYMINLGSIEINPWSSRVQHLERPDWGVIDLDPEVIGFVEVKRTAQIAHNILQKIGAKHFLKTSGATGLHIYLPFEPKHDYEQIKNLIHLIVTFIHQELPEITSLERLPKKRQGKIYLDYLQNNRGQTLAAPYSVRPRPGAPVSAPLEWDELKKDFEPRDFNIQNIEKRIRDKGEIFRGVLEEKNNLEEILKKVEGLLNNN